MKDHGSAIRRVLEARRSGGAGKLGGGSCREQVGAVTDRPGHNRRLPASPTLSARDAGGLALATADRPPLMAARSMPPPQRITRLKRNGGFGVSAALPAGVPPPMP